MANHQDETRTAYDGVVELYASLFANRLETQPFSRAMIRTFAELVRATSNLRTADVGCGPGHLTAMLHELGLDAFGLDLAPGMVDHARQAHPALRFQEARMESLPIEDAALGGVLAHYSMIHTLRGNYRSCSPNRYASWHRTVCSWSPSSGPTDKNRFASTTKWRPPTAGR